MKQKSVIWMVAAAMLVAFLAGGGFVGYKLLKRKQNREANQRWEVKRVMPVPPDADLPAILAESNAKLDRYEVMRPVVDELDLVAFWSLSTVDEAVEQLKECSNFRSGKQVNTVEFFVRDKDQEMAGKLADAIGKHYDQAQRRETMLQGGGGQ